MIGSVVLAALLMIFIEKILFALESIECRIIDFLYNLFEIFAGIKYMKYNGENTLFIDIFFDNNVITTLYIGMACIGAAMAFGFAIVAVIKKVFDITGEKMKTTYGQIITNLFKSILLMFLMTVIVDATILASSTLLTQIDYLFDNVEAINNPEEIEFTDTQRGTMYSALSTIGNYTLNESTCNNRYNLNSCFNAIRPDLKQLEKEGVFKFNYEGAESSWQYWLLQIYLKCDGVDTDRALDSYNEELFAQILEVGRRIKQDGKFAPISSYVKLDPIAAGREATLGRTIMMCGSMTAARCSSMNKNATLTDSLRGPFYYGKKDCYSYGTMNGSFDLGIFSWDHIVVIVVGWFVIVELAKLMFNAIARVFNIILLYVTAPGFLAVMPLDDGGKFKQWTLAFIIQSLSVVGSFIAVRLMVMFVPIVMADNFVVIEGSSFGNYIAKLTVLCGIVFTAGKASGMISGILADQAGYQSIMAGDVGSGLGQAVTSFAGKALATGAKAGFKLGGKALSTVGDATGLTHAGKTALKKTGLDKLSNLGQSMRDNKGGIVGAFKSGFKTDAIRDQEKKEAKEKAAEKDQKDFREGVLTKLESLVSGGPSGNQQSQAPSNAEKPKEAMKPPVLNLGNKE